jgi:hypothetical protein
MCCFYAAVAAGALHGICRNIAPLADLLSRMSIASGWICRNFFHQMGWNRNGFADSGFQQPLVARMLDLTALQGCR